MTQFEFITVFVSILLALGVSDVLNSWGDQIRLRDKVTHYWLHTVWGILYLLMTIQAWWGMWRLRHKTDWTFLDNLIQLFPYMLLALIAYVLTPRLTDGQTDIREYYYKNAPWVFGLGAVFLFGLMINTRNALDTPLFDVSNLIRAVAILLLIALATWRNEMFHKVAVITAYALLGTYISVTLIIL